MDCDQILPQLEVLHPDAFGWAVSCCGGDLHRGEDVLQAAYTKALQGKVRFEGRSALKTWWFGVIRFTALEEHRRAGRWLAFLDRWKQEPVEEGGEESSADGADAELLALNAALARLSERQREVLHLAFYQGLSLSEAAGVMGVSIGSARQHYERGKRRLRELLPKKEASDE
jgi:RNA polymerase sigma-70 factor (ECF subfamily)